MSEAEQIERNRYFYRIGKLIGAIWAIPPSSIQ